MEESKKMTICTECKHLGIVSGHNSNIWYSRYCKAFPVKQRRDPFDGKLKPADTDPPTDRYDNPRDHNSGDCPEWQAESKKSTRADQLKKGDCILRDAPIGWDVVVSTKEEQFPGGKPAISIQCESSLDAWWQSDPSEKYETK